MRAQLIALAAAGLLCGCDGAAEPAPVPKGDYPASQHAAGADEMSDDLFTATKIPCSDEASIAGALFEITKSQMSAGAKPQLINYGVDPVSLKDGPGKIAAVVYSFEPGDEGVVSTATDSYLVNDSCHVQHWKQIGP